MAKAKKKRLVKRRPQKARGLTASRVYRLLWPVRALTLKAQKEHKGGHRAKAVETVEEAIAKLKEAKAVLEKKDEATGG